ncbi:MAG: hypothetical protein V1921_03585 [Candidatus Altiarchaeota archaeon]
MAIDIGYYEVWGVPLIIYGGIITLLSLFITASIAVLNRKGVTKIPFKWHPRMAKLSIILAVTHATLVVLSRI